MNQRMTFSALVLFGGKEEVIGEYASPTEAQDCCQKHSCRSGRKRSLRWEPLDESHTSYVSSTHEGRYMVQKQI